MIREAVECCEFKDRKWNGTLARDGHGYEYWLGAAYGEVEELDVADISAKIRSDLRKVWETDAGFFDPKRLEIKTSVRLHRYAGGASINVTIEKLPFVNIGWDYREDVKVHEQISQIANRYLRQTTHGVSDGFWSNFMLFVNYSGKVEDLIADLPRRPEVTPDDYRGRAIKNYVDGNYVDDGIVIDADANVDLSPNGAFVQAWVWVPLSDFDTTDEEE